MFVEDGELCYESCSQVLIPDSRGVKLLSPNGETTKMNLIGSNDDMNITRIINLSKTGSFESPIEGFVMMINGTKKMITINKETNGFEIINTNQPFRTNHHYLMSKDSKIYKLKVVNNVVNFVEQNVDEFEIECIKIGAFIKSNEMISRVDIENGKVVIKPISTFMHRLKADDNTSYIMDVEGDPYEEVLAFRKIESDDFSKSVGIGCLHLQDESGIYYKVNIDKHGNLHFAETDSINTVNYEVSSVIYSSLGWYRLYVENYQIQLEKIFDNMYDNRMSYGNLVKKDLVISSDNNVNYSLHANGNGELNIEKVKPVNVNGIVLRSDNGYVYGLGLINDRIASYESYITNPAVPTRVYLQDISTRLKYALFMCGDRLYSEKVSSNIKAEDHLLIYDVYRNENWLFMKDGKLTTSNPGAVNTTAEINSVNNVMLNALSSIKKGV